MPLSDLVTVVVSLTGPGVTQAGFGIPLIPSYSATWAERTRTYKQLTDVAGDFAATTPEYLAAQAIFAQSPCPSAIKIGRFALKPTQVWVVAITAAGVTAGAAGGVKFTLRVNNGTINQTATYTSVGADTNDLIIAGLNAALQALAGYGALGFTSAITGAGGSHVITITATTPGNWLAIEVGDSSAGAVGNLMYQSETEVDPGTATDLTAILNADNTWYALGLTFKSQAILLAAAAWIESNKRFFVAACPETHAATDVVTTNVDTIDKLKALNYTRTGSFFHPRNDEFADFAELGRFLPLLPGQDNWRLKTLAGVSVANLTPTQIANLNNKNANYYYTLGGLSLVGGKGMSTQGEYLDVTRFIDWWVAQVQQGLANLLIQNNKVPYTDDGIAAVEAVVRAANQAGIDQGGIAKNPKPTVTVPLAANVSSADRAARQLNNVNTAWQLAGAINALAVNATVTQ